MPQIIDPGVLVPIVLDSDAKKARPTIFWCERIGPIDNARMEAIGTTAAQAALSAGWSKTDPELYEKTRAAELGFLASKVKKITDWPGREGEEITDPGQIEECLRRLVWAEYLELHQKLVGVQHLTPLEGKASDSQS